LGFVIELLREHTVNHTSSHFTNQTQNSNFYFSRPPSDLLESKRRVQA